MELTPNLTKEEFEPDGPMPEECVPAYECLAKLIQAICDFYVCRVKIDSGYRPPNANKAAGGVAHSQHMATADHCAADFYLLPGHELLPAMRDVFDWLRLESKLQFDQLILEHGNRDILHMSWSKTPRRMALEGATANRSGYKPWPVH